MYTQPQQSDIPPGAQLVTLEPVYVTTSRIGPMIAACRRHDIYFQFGERKGHETVFYVLPADLEFATHLASTVCGPMVGSGCKLPFFSLVGLVFAGLALAVSMIGV